MILKIIGYAFALVGIYVTLNNKISKLELLAQTDKEDIERLNTIVSSQVKTISVLEPQVNTNTQNIAKIDNLIQNELKEIKDMLIQLRIENAIAKAKEKTND